MKKLPLWFWGLACMFGGIISRLLMQAFASRPEMSTAQGKAAAMGRAAAMLMFMLAGVVLIVLHFVLKRRRS